MSCKNIDLPKQYGCHKMKQRKSYKKKYSKYDKPYFYKQKYRSHRRYNIQHSRTFRKRKYIANQYRKRTNKPWIRKFKISDNKSKCKCYLCGEMGGRVQD